MIIIIFSTASLHSIFFQYTDSRRQRSLRFSTLQRSFHILKVTFYHLSAQRFIKYFRLFVGTVHKSNSFSLNTMYNLQHLKFIFHTIVVTHKHLVISTLKQNSTSVGKHVCFQQSLSCSGLFQVVVACCTAFMVPPIAWARSTILLISPMLRVL